MPSGVDKIDINIIPKKKKTTIKQRNTSLFKLNKSMHPIVIANNEAIVPGAIKIFPTPPRVAILTKVDSYIELNFKTYLCNCLSL